MEWKNVRRRTEEKIKADTKTCFYAWHLIIRRYICLCLPCCFRRSQRDYGVTASKWTIQPTSKEKKQQNAKYHLSVLSESEQILNEWCNGHQVAAATVDIVSLLDVQLCFVLYTFSRCNCFLFWEMGNIYAFTRTHLVQAVRCFVFCKADLRDVLYECVACFSNIRCQEQSLWSVRVISYEFVFLFSFYTLLMEKILCN